MACIGVNVAKLLNYNKLDKRFRNSVYYPVHLVNSVYTKMCWMQDPGRLLWQSNIGAIGRPTPQAPCAGLGNYFNKTIFQYQFVRNSLMKTLEVETATCIVMIWPLWTTTNFFSKWQLWFFLPNTHSKFQKKSLLSDFMTFCLKL